MNNVNRRKTDSNIINSYNNDDNVEMNCESIDNYQVQHNYIRRHTDNNPINSQTLINVDSEQPMGLDLNNFMNNVDPDQTIHAISQSNDLPIIAEVNFFYIG